jgi:cellulose synthase/poly-beta-1,6-N-acetylglucosamine synthase-like glycosyltransferase
MVVIDVLLVGLNLAVVAFFLFLLAISLAAIFSRRERLAWEEPRSRFRIAIPAHDEESDVATAVQSCLNANYPSSLFSVTVIADNCSDRTASAAANAGARVVERFEPDKKSKGYAIEFLIEDLVRSGEFDALDALVIVDADTTVDPEVLRCFDQALLQGCDWIQCYYTVANPDRSWRTRLLTYAFSLFNGVMLLGQNALGLSAGLRGNGMCFSTRGLRRRPWRSTGLVEDIEYSWTLRIAGETIAFQPRVSVYGAMPGSGGQAAVDQRLRWEFGRRDIRRKYFMPLLRSDRLGWWEKMASACELAIPTMTALLILYLLLVALDASAFFSSGLREAVATRWTLLGCSLLMSISLAVYAVSPFLVMRLPWKYLCSLVFLPVYLCWKLLVSLRGRPKRWVRTTRESRTGELI